MKYNNITFGNRKLKIISMILCATILVIILSTSIMALGIAPSRKIISFNPSETTTIEIRIVNEEQKESQYMIYLEEELAKYVETLGSKPISEGQKVIVRTKDNEYILRYTIKMPEILSPGTHNLSVVVVDMPTDIETNSDTRIVSTVSVAHQLRVEVPYPGKFADGFLYVGEGNINDSITFTANIVNKGKEKIDNVSAVLVIKGPTNEEIARIPSNQFFSLDTQTSQKIVENWKANVNQGVYYAEYIINYDEKQFVLRKTFMIGNKDIEIRNVDVKNFKIGTIAKIDMEILNRWNEPISGVYSDMQIIDSQGRAVSQFQTNPIEVKQLSTAILTGYWDTSGLNVGSYDLKTTMHYQDKSKEQIFKTIIGIDSISIEGYSGTGNVIVSEVKGSSISLLFLLVGVSIIFNIGLFIYFKFMRKNSSE